MPSVHIAAEPFSRDGGMLGLTLARAGAALSFLYLVQGGLLSRQKLFSSCTNLQTLPLLHIQQIQRPNIEYDFSYSSLFFYCHPRVFEAKLFTLLKLWICKFKAFTVPGAPKKIREPGGALLHLEIAK